MKVIVQYDEKVETFENVTKVQCSLAFDMFENIINIHQGSKITAVKQYKINGVEIVDE